MIQSETHELPALPGTPRSLAGVLRRLLGKPVVVVAPDHLELRAVGYHVGAGCYEAQVLDVQGEYVVLEYYATVDRGTRNQREERARQMVPLREIRRVTITRTRRTIHL